jgi:hypothetical protein
LAALAADDRPTRSACRCLLLRRRRQAPPPGRRRGWRGPPRGAEDRGTGRAASPPCERCAGRGLSVVVRGQQRCRAGARAGSRGSWAGDAGVSTVRRRVRAGKTPLSSGRLGPTLGGSAKGCSYPSIQLPVVRNREARRGEPVAASSICNPPRTTFAASAAIRAKPAAEHLSSTSTALDRRQLGSCRGSR